MQTEIIELLVPPKRASFGEFLVQLRVLDRFQLLRALQLKDRLPGARLGQCAVALGFVAPAAIEQLHACFAEIADVGFETMPTEAFHREPDIEIVHSLA